MGRSSVMAVVGVGGAKASEEAEIHPAEGVRTSHKLAEASRGSQQSC